MDHRNTDNRRTIATLSGHTRGVQVLALHENYVYHPSFPDIRERKPSEYCHSLQGTSSESIPILEMYNIRQLCTIFPKQTHVNGQNGPRSAHPTGGFEGGLRVGVVIQSPVFFPENGNKLFSPGSRLKWKKQMNVVEESWTKDISSSFHFISSAGKL